MVTAVRAEAVITAQNRLRPGLASAAAELGRFRAMQSKASAAFSSVAARAQAAQVLAQQRALAGAQAAALAAGRNIAVLGGPAALGLSYKRFADVDRQISRIGVTANASAGELGGVRKQIEGIADETALAPGKVTGGLDVLVAQGRSLKDSLQFLPAVARTAAATGAEVDDIAKSADAVSSNFKIAGENMQAAFDVMAEGGKAGQFELKDMARYLPSLAPSAAAAGFRGQRGVTDLVSMLQILRKGAGSSEEAQTFMANIFQKMETEETAKKFKKLGVDVAAGMKKGREEGRNLVEVFEDLTAQALKGDISKIPQLFSDAQFAGGMRALMTYRGEWQKLARTIGETANGAVGRDLAKVTNDARAQIDRLMATIENRSVQVGAFLARNLILPIDEALKRIADGKNPIANAIEDRARHVNADTIARDELSGGPVRDYGDADYRRLIDARKEYLQRERIDQERERLGGVISDLTRMREAEKKRIDDGGPLDWLTGDTSRAATEKALASLEAKEKRQGLSPLDKVYKSKFQERLKGGLPAIDARLAGAEQSLAGLNTLVAAIDEINIKLAEVAAPRRAAAQPRLAQPPPGQSFAYVGPGGRAFAPTLGGGGAQTSIQYGGVPISVEAPPIRPGELSLKPSSSDDIKSALGEFDTSSLVDARARAADVRTTIESLGPAGASAGTALGAGISSGLSQADAAIDAFIARTQQKLNSLRAPSLSFGTGAGGLPVGRSMPEVR